MSLATVFLQNKNPVNKYQMLTQTNKQTDGEIDIMLIHMLTQSGQLKSIN